MADDVLTQAIEEVVAEATTPETPVEKTEESVDWAAKYEADKAEWESKHSALEEQLRPYRDYFSKLEADSLSRITENVLAPQVNEDGEPKPVSAQERDLVMSLVKEGAAFRQARTDIVKNDIALEAINLAYEIVGDNATAGELKAAAAELTKLGADFLDNPQAAKSLMARSAKVYREKLRMDTAQRRVSTGVDQISRAPAQSGIATDESVLVQKVSDGTASPEEEARLAAIWGARRRQPAY